MSHVLQQNYMTPLPEAIVHWMHQLPRDYLSYATLCVFGIQTGDCLGHHVFRVGLNLIGQNN